MNESDISIARHKRSGTLCHIGRPCIFQESLLDTLEYEYDCVGHVTRLCREKLTLDDACHACVDGLSRRTLLTRKELETA